MFVPARREKSERVYCRQRQTRKSVIFCSSFSEFRPLKGR